MSQCLRLRPPPALHHFKAVPFHSKKPANTFKLSIRNCSAQPENAAKLVMEVKQKLEREHNSLPVGKNGRDDEEMILWFLKDRKFSVEDAIAKLTKAIRWRREFGVSELSFESVKSVAETGKAYVHENLDVYGRPVLIVEAAKHIPGEHPQYDDEKLCVFMIEKALEKLPPGKQDILGIIDLRGFQTQNADIKFLIFVFALEEFAGPDTKKVNKIRDRIFFDAFYYYYPRRLGQVLFVDAPFVFKPVWQLVKPLVKSYASLVRFCSAKTVKEEYFTADTVPPNFRY